MALNVSAYEPRLIRPLKSSLSLFQIKTVTRAVTKIIEYFFFYECYAMQKFKQYIHSILGPMQNKLYCTKQK